ncbi:MAG: TMEM165/GDT1 family protein [Tepidibacillus sp.]
MISFLVATVFVTLAEMGDKTQLLAIAFASRYSSKQVMLGVFLATIFNHGLAVAFGDFLTSKISLNMIQIGAAVLFVLFGIWTIRGDQLNGEENRFKTFGPIMAVTMAFFIAELGDKTQLATIALAAKYQSPYFVLAGTTLGMLIADGIGIWFGTWLNQKLSAQMIKWISAFIFIFFGLAGLYRHLPDSLILYLNFITLALILGVGFIFRKNVSKEKLHSEKL